MTGRQKKSLTQIIISALLLIFAWVLPIHEYITLALLLASYIAAGYNVLIKAGRNILRGQIFDENFLMSIATIGAVAIGEYPEGVAVMIFYQVGELFNSVAVDRSRKSIASLMDIRPDFANILDSDAERRVSPD